MIFLLFSLVSFFINFTVYPVVDKYLIKPYEQRLQEEKNGPAPEKEEVEEEDPETARFLLLLRLTRMRTTMTRWFTSTAA